jgi:hypothetical protein
MTINIAVAGIPYLTGLERPMRIASVLAVGLVLLNSPLCAAHAQQAAGLVQPIQASEFLKLPSDLQAVYVGGILEGIAFSAYGYSDTRYPAWVTCVRRETLGNTTDDVVAFIKQTPNFDEGVASALAQVLGKRSKH